MLPINRKHGGLYKYRVTERARRGCKGSIWEARTRPRGKDFKRERVLYRQWIGACNYVYS